MKKELFATIRWELIVLICILSFLPPGVTANSCETCHASLGNQGGAGQAYLDWQGTAHARSGVTCDKCHGGNPNKPAVMGAHQGVLDPSNPASPVYVENIPKLCGECHRPQLKEFLRSKHYKAIQNGKEKVHGPTCVTCHGSMHTSILMPENVAEACRECHKPGSNLPEQIPEEAHATLGLIFYAKNAIQWSAEFVQMAESRGYAVSEAAAVLKDAEEKYEASKVKWHSFDFKEILENVDGAYQSAKEAKRLVDEALVMDLEEKE